MSLDQITPDPTLNHNDDDENSTVYTANNTPPAYTPSNTIAEPEPTEDDDWFSRGEPKPNSFPVPWPGSTFIIRCVSSRNVITLLDGQIVLMPPGDDDHGSIYWECVEIKGWLGFRNTASGKFLGHDAKGRLCCVAERHQGWEWFCARMKPEGGCVLLMKHYERLWHVGIVKLEQGEEKLAKIGDGGADGMVWEFDEI